MVKCVIKKVLPLGKPKRLPFLLRVFRFCWFLDLSSLFLNPVLRGIGKILKSTSHHPLIGNPTKHPRQFSSSDPSSRKGDDVGKDILTSPTSGPSVWHIGVLVHLPLRDFRESLEIIVYVLSSLLTNREKLSTLISSGLNRVSRDFLWSGRDVPP